MFIDRDGVLIRQVDELVDPAQIELFPDAAAAIAALKAKGFLAIGITNQPIIEKGLLTMEGLRRINAVLQEKLSIRGGASLDAIYVCPHRYRAEGQCECRKPGQKLLADAQNDFDIDMAGSWFVGDRLRDVETGRRAGIRTILVATGGESKDDEFFPETRPDYVVSALSEAVDRIIK